MDDNAKTSGHLMLITPQRVFYAGLLGRPRERCPGAFHVYVALRGSLWLTTADGREVCGELVATAPNLRHTIATDLPVGAPPGVVPKPLRGIMPFSGPQGPFAGIAAGPDGTLYVSADSEGSVLALRQGNVKRRSSKAPSPR